MEEEKGVFVFDLICVLLWEREEEKVFRFCVEKNWWWESGFWIRCEK